MRDYTADKYQDFVEGTTDDKLRNYMLQERDFIKHIDNAANRTFIDLGAGHGRIIGDLAQAGKNVIAIEINPDMYLELDKRAGVFENAKAIRGDILELGALLAGQEVARPIFLITQNSLGTIEGDANKVLDVVIEQTHLKDGEILLSFFRQPALRSWGLGMYASMEDMVGAVDVERTDADKGLFVSKTGYISKWWTDDEINSFKTLGSVVKEHFEPEFHIILLRCN